MAFVSPIFVPGCTFFFTVRLQDPASDLLIRHIDLLRLSVRLCQQQYPFIIRNAVILPGKVHMLWDLPPGDVGHAVRWRIIKSTFARHLPRDSRRTSGRTDTGIWQRQPCRQVVFDARVLSDCMALIAAAPVVAGLVENGDDWPYSTAARLAETSSQVNALRR